MLQLYFFQFFSFCSQHFLYKFLNLKMKFIYFLFICLFVDCGAKDPCMPRKHSITEMLPSPHSVFKQ